MLFAGVSGAGIAAFAQEQIIIEPLFEYPVPPEDMDNLQDRSAYLLEHFWDKMDFKEKSTVDQNALNDAFAVYTTPMQFADEKVSDTSVANLLKSISKNSTLSLQFAKAAEEALYGPRAYYWNDQLYLKFIDNVLRNKGVKKERKLRYEHQKKLLENTLKGTVPPQFDYYTAEGKLSHYAPDGVITVIEFGDPDCDDCRQSKLKMQTNVAFSSMVDKGKVNVLFIIPDPEDGWQKQLANYPAKWHCGASETVSDLYDMRNTPSIYVIDREGKVAVKNTDVTTAMEIAVAAATE